MRLHIKIKSPLIQVDEICRSHARAMKVLKLVKNADAMKKPKESDFGMDSNFARAGYSHFERMELYWQAKQRYMEWEDKPQNIHVEIESL